MDDKTHIGRPRSEHARTAVLHAVDDLLVEVGYAALTMKGIAERAGVGRQTVYRWWSTKAEVLFEATITDAAHELASAAQTTTVEDIAAYLEALTVFLTESPAGAGYRALIGEAQHDPAVAQLMESADLFTPAAKAVLERAIDRGDLPNSVPAATAIAILTGPAYFHVLAGRPGRPLASRNLATALLAALRERRACTRLAVLAAAALSTAGLAVTATTATAATAHGVTRCGNARTGSAGARGRPSRPRQVVVTL